MLARYILYIFPVFGVRIFAQEGQDFSEEYCYLFAPGC